MFKSQAYNECHVRAKVPILCENVIFLSAGYHSELFDMVSTVLLNETIDTHIHDS